RSPIRSWGHAEWISHQCTISSAIARNTPTRPACRSSLLGHSAGRRLVDMSKLPWRIEEARKALIFRSRELFKTPPSYDGETEAIENALYALQALENSLKSNTRDRRHAARAG